MRPLAIAGLAAVVVILGACGNPCDKLAKKVCAKAKDAKVCAEVKAQAKNASNAKKKTCREQLKDVDKIVAFLTAPKKAAEEAKAKPKAKEVDTPLTAAPAPPPDK